MGMFCCDKNCYKGPSFKEQSQIRHEVHENKDAWRVYLEQSKYDHELEAMLQTYLKPVSPFFNSIEEAKEWNEKMKTQLKPIVLESKIG